MDAKTNLKARLPSRHVTEGPEQAGLRPRDIVTRKALENAAEMVAAFGGSTNGALHLPAIANECGLKFDLFDVAEVFKKTPYIADLKPGGRYVAKDLFEAGGVLVLMKTLAPTLAAISTGAVFMGANTYIGNAPNLMVKAIAVDRGIKMPSFFGYMAWSGAVLIPLFIIMTFIWFK